MWVDPDFVITEWSPYLVDLLGYTAAEMLGRRAFEVLAPSGDRAARVYALRSGKQWLGPVTLRHRNGTRLWFFAAAATLRNRLGVIYGYRVRLVPGFDPEHPEPSEDPIEDAELNSSQFAGAESRGAGHVPHEGTFANAGPGASSPAMPTATAEDVERVIRANMRRYRNRAGLSQAALADELGVQRNHVTEWETGKRGLPDISRLALIARTLGVTFAELVDPPTVAEPEPEPEP